MTLWTPRTGRMFRWLPASIVLAGLAPAALAQQTRATPPALTEPAARTDEGWVKRQEQINERAKQGDIELIFLGDSITQGWEGAGKEVWDKYYGARKAANMGIGGDGTQHILYRLDHGNIDGLKPKALVLMIGTNNSPGDTYTAEQIADGIGAIITKLRTKLPETKILLLAIFPRSERPDATREKNAKVSELASKLADGKMVYYMDIGKEFLGPDGVLSKEIMPDFLHLTPKGYEIWAKAIEAKLTELLGEKKAAAKP